MSEVSSSRQRSLNKSERIRVSFAAAFTNVVSTGVRFSRSMAPMPASAILTPFDPDSGDDYFYHQATVDDVTRAVRISDALGLCLGVRGSILWWRVFGGLKLTRSDCIATLQLSVNARARYMEGLDFDKTVIAHKTNGTTRKMPPSRLSALSRKGGTTIGIFVPCDRKGSRKSSNGGYGTILLLPSSSDAAYFAAGSS